MILGLRINQQKEVILDVCHGKVKLPDDFYTFNFAFICGTFTENSWVMMVGLQVLTFKKYLM